MKRVGALATWSCLGLSDKKTKNAIRCHPLAIEARDSVSIPTGYVVHITYTPLIKASIRVPRSPLISQKKHPSHQKHLPSYDGRHNK